jgi:hypothetical protein
VKDLVDLALLIGDNQLASTKMVSKTYFTWIVANS